MKFKHIVCGGTFDHLHIGHKTLLNTCAQQASRVTVGVTTRATTRHKAYISSLETYTQRVKNVTDFNSTFTIYKLQDMYGPTLTDRTIDAICVTNETLAGAQLINKKRKELGIKPLSIILVPFEYDTNGEKISSERIRQGLINRTGQSYYKYLISKKIHYLPELLRGQLRKPLGRVIPSFEALLQQRKLVMKEDSNDSAQVSTVTVGDVVTYNFKQSGFFSTFSIIDGITCRKALNNEYIDSILETAHLDAPNKKGTIQQEAVNAVYKIVTMGHKKAIKQLVINGEEDLLTLVAVLFTPLGSHVWYGQQGVGAIDIRVTEKKKETVYNLIRQFN